MSKDKVIFGEAQSIVEQTRTKPTGMIAKRIQRKNVKKTSINNNVSKKNMSNNIKKPNSFSK